MLRNRPLTHIALTSMLHYVPETGEWTWLESRGAIVLGSPAGTIDDKGYRVIKINRKSYKSSRLAWFFVHQKWPDGFIDHINGIRHDDRLENLRLANAESNAWNRPVNSRNKCGLKGAQFNAEKQKWRSEIRWNGGRKFLGYFDTAEEAHEAYRMASAILHGEFFRV